MAKVEKSRRDRANRKLSILAQDKSDLSVHSEEGAGEVTELATQIRAWKFSDAKVAFGYLFICSKHIKMLVNGFKVTLGIVCVQKF